jgi:hypothetical protein
MGRPPIGKKAMTATEHQRRWRQKRRRQTPSAPAWLSADLALIERLTHERDYAREGLELALRPRVAGPDDPDCCFLCQRRQDEVEVLFKLPRPEELRLCICDRCIKRMSVECHKVLAEATFYTSMRIQRSVDELKRKR